MSFMSDKLDIQQLREIWRQNGPDVKLAGEISNLLLNKKCFFELEMFLSTLPNTEKYKTEEALNRSRAYLEFQRKRYGNLYQLLKGNTFTDAEDLVKLWDAAHYEEERAKKRKPLTPLAKFRIRQRFTPPKTICPKGRQKSTLPKEATRILQSWLNDNLGKPYPDAETKERLQQLTKLSKTQVNTWFANARRRLNRNRQQEDTKKPTRESKPKPRSSLCTPTSPPPNACPWALGGIHELAPMTHGIPFLCQEMRHYYTHGIEPHTAAQILLNLHQN
ncbi:homeobox protein SIX6 [Nematostella vectensis]|nr:homeobox protein SIX6 [Nematostella vectensis]